MISVNLCRRLRQLQPEVASGELLSRKADRSKANIKTDGRTGGTRAARGAPHGAGNADWDATALRLRRRRSDER